MALRTTKPVRLINVVPLKKTVKVEPVSDDEDVVSCKLCAKTFSNEVALRNHARMEHIEAFTKGDPALWTSSIKPTTPSKKHKLERVDKSIKKKENENPDEIKLNNEKILSSMTAGNIMSLASNDISYIIIKSEDDLPEETKKKKRERDVKIKYSPRASGKKKEPEPITGPFECVQPSTQAADGVCHQIFFSCCEYSSHFRDMHMRRCKGLRCQVCEKPLLQKDEGSAPYTCEVCGAGFNATKELSEHTSIAHVKLKPFQCSVCHQRFTQKGGVKQHMRMHTGERPFPCSFCDKAFTQKSGLDQHVRIHTKVKPYRCVVCGKSFCQPVHLKQHMRIHTKVKPYRCVVCGKTFCQPVHLKHHMRTHTNVAPFQCGICQKRFKQNSQLKVHFRNHKPDNMTDDQKQKYESIASMIINGVGQVEIPETEVTETEETMEIMETTEVTEDMEQVMAEQSIQVILNEDCEEYVISDDTEQT